MSCFSRYIVSLKGGIGNQLFQYAYAKYLSSVEGKVAYTYYKIKEDPYKRENIIKEIDPGIYIQKGLVNRIAIRVISRPANLLTQVIRQCASILGLRFAIKKQEESQYYQYIKNLNEKQVTILNGYWQSARMVNLVKQELLQYLKCSELSPAHKKIAQDINNENQVSVAVHVRSSWNIGYSGNVPSTLAEHSQQTLTRDYYRAAIIKMQSKAKSKRLFFFVFADDTHKASDIIGGILPKDSYVIVPNYNNIHDDYQALILMSYCKHFIISNSTFGWWGAWLSWAKQQSQKKNAIYCMPARWDKSDKAEETSQCLKFSSQCILIHN